MPEVSASGAAAAALIVDEALPASASAHPGIGVQAPVPEVARVDVEALRKDVKRKVEVVLRARARFLPAVKIADESHVEYNDCNYYSVPAVNNEVQAAAAWDKLVAAAHRAAHLYSILRQCYGEAAAAQSE